MTLIFEDKKKCAVCSEISWHGEIESTNAFGSPDLDMRPPPMKRSTINKWIQTCPSCGYCAPNISKTIEELSEIIRSDIYQEQLNNPEFPKLANAFLCFSLIQDNIGKYASAGWATIHAAWACDDAGSNVGARKCREIAVNLLQKAKENNQKYAEEIWKEDAIMIDLLRRSSQFNAASEIGNEALKKYSEIRISNIFKFQKMLIDTQDISCHKIMDSAINLGL